MQIVAIGLHFIIAVYFAVHAIRTGRAVYWLLILFMIPMGGSLAYFAAMFLPQSRRHYRAGS